MSVFKNLFKPETNLFPWIYTLFIVFVFFCYLGASSYFQENVEDVRVRAARSRFIVNNPDLRALSLNDGRVALDFNWHRHLLVQSSGRVQRRLLPQSYEVHSGEVLLEFREGVDIGVKSTADVLTLRAVLPAGRTVVLPWRIDDEYSLVEENSSRFFLAKAGDTTPIFEVYSSDGQTEINKNKIVFHGQASVVVRPYGAGKLTLDEWLEREGQGQVDPTMYQQLKKKYLQTLYTELTQKLENTRSLTMQEEESLGTLAVLESTVSGYGPLMEKMKALGTLDFVASGFTGGMAASMASYADYVRRQVAAVNVAVRDNDRRIFAQTGLADFLVNHNLSRAHQSLVKLASADMATVSIENLVNQLLFLLDSQRIRATSAKASIIVQHLNRLLPSILGLYRGLYLAADKSEYSFLLLSGMKLGYALNRLPDLDITEGVYAAHYSSIGIKLLETGMGLFASLNRIPQKMILRDEVVSYSEEVVTLAVLPFIMAPQYITREHAEQGELSRTRYILSAAGDVLLDSTQGGQYSISMKWPAGIPQEFVVFNVPAIDKIIVNKGELSRSTSANLGTNQWFYNAQSKILFVQTTKPADFLSIRLEFAGPVEPAIPAPAVPKPVPAPSPPLVKEPEPEPELTAEEKKKLERQKREEEKKQEEQRKRDEQKKREEDKKQEEQRKRDEQKKREEEKKQENSKK